ncbi:MAG: YkgJ family cysteine cluster protein [Candidatus Bathyarchaeota archaeon]|nr:MAG: YkgJ family cysteine cluster protein [Candidatus Bathyarchaeota archaeon]
MRIVPWNLISTWHCTRCGICCRKYDVVLKLPEWLNIVKAFGVEYTAASISKFLLRRRADGSCVFLHWTPNVFLCSLQRTKPKACKLWPFKVLDKPGYGSVNDAEYHYGHRRLFVYVDPMCPGLRYGVPKPEFVYSVIPEFIEIALGVRHKQFKTTANL